MITKEEKQKYLTKEEINLYTKYKLKDIINYFDKYNDEYVIFHTKTKETWKFRTITANVSEYILLQCNKVIYFDFIKNKWLELTFDRIVQYILEPNNLIEHPLNNFLYFKRKRQIIKCNLCSNWFFTTKKNIDICKDTKCILTKTKKTKLERYGNEYYCNKEKIKENFKDPEIKKKYLKNLNKHFNKLKNDKDYRKKVQNKRNITKINKLKENPNYFKEIHNKTKKTKLDRYGDENYQNIEKLKKQKEKNMVMKIIVI